MSTFTSCGLLLCLAACLLQGGEGQYLSSGIGVGYGNVDCGCSRGAGYAWQGVSGSAWGVPEVVGGYGGEGVGDLEVAGELPVAGTTLVAGQVPVLGAVQFAGEVPAAGIVTITGRCGCDCNGSPLF
ncbi:PREDICTED: chorion class A protein Ld2/Ld41-like [Papilio polytes]|uniref:chorion class A protein Ld2/Ld41-like n=1 Tax=Papilio polytes TaxID=76194 RepID=UPI0006762498|nr:PREDICTED: chorion class A protein Ld2/Ld41-like [Papilio polytes]